MIDIFYKSYKNDFKWLYHSLESLSKYVTGYNEIVILIPESDVKSFDYRKIPQRTRVLTVKEYGNGYLYQQWCKMSAYKYCKSEFILFADSDCIFDHDINLQDYIGTPEILFTDYSKVGDAICWKQVTETMLDREVRWEFMRRNCLVYHTSTLKNIAQKYPNLEHTIMNSERFSEFNFIGAYAFFNEYSKYKFVNTDEWEYVRPKSIQYHSYTEFDKMLKEFSNIVK